MESMNPGDIFTIGSSDEIYIIPTIPIYTKGLGDSFIINGKVHSIILPSNKKDNDQSEYDNISKHTTKVNLK